MEVSAKDVPQTRAPYFDESRGRDLCYIHQYSSSLVTMALEHCNSCTEIETVTGGSGLEPRVNVYLHKTREGAKLGLFVIWPVQITELSQVFWDRLYCGLCRDIGIMEKEIEREQRFKD